MTGKGMYTDFALSQMQHAESRTQSSTLSISGPCTGGFRARRSKSAPSAGGSGNSSRQLWAGKTRNRSRPAGVTHTVNFVPSMGTL